jgi:hypothetical protein
MDRNVQASFQLDDLWLTLQPGGASESVFRRVEFVFQAVLEGRESFRGVGLRLPELIDCIFGFQDRSRGSWSETVSGWLPDCERRAARPGDADALVSLLEPRGPLFQTLLCHDERYTYDFPLQNLPQPLLDEIAAVLSGEDANVRTAVAASPHPDRKPENLPTGGYSPLAYYLSAHVTDPTHDTVRIGAARYYLLCFLAYPVYARHPTVNERFTSAWDTSARQHIYERVLLAFLQEFASLQQLLHQHVSFERSAATTLSVADLFVHAWVAFWFHWNGELWPWNGWHDAVANDWGQMQLARYRERHSVPSLLTMKCQRLAMVHVMGVFETHADQVERWSGCQHIINQDRVPVRHSEPFAGESSASRDTGVPRKIPSAGTPSLQVYLNIPLGLQHVDASWRAWHPNQLGSSGAAQRTNPLLRFLLIVFCRYFCRTIPRMQQMCIDLDASTNVAFLKTISAWLFPWDQATELSALLEKARDQRGRRVALLHGLALLHTPFVEEPRKSSQYKTSCWRRVLALHFPLYVRLLVDMLNILVRSRCLLQSPGALEFYLDLHRSAQCRDWLADLQKIAHSTQAVESRQQPCIEAWSEFQHSRCSPNLSELAGLDCDAFRQTLRELRLQLERRLHSSWNTSAVFLSRLARDRAAHLVEPWIQLVEPAEFPGSPKARDPLSNASVQALDDTDSLGVIHRRLPAISPDRSVTSPGGAPQHSAAAAGAREPTTPPSMSTSASSRTDSEMLPLGAQIALGRKKCSNLDIVPRGDAWRWPKQSNEFGPALVLARRLALKLEQLTGVSWNLRFLASYVVIGYLAVGLTLSLLWLMVVSGIF